MNIKLKIDFLPVAGATFRGYVKGEFSSGGSFWMELARNKEQEKDLQTIKQAVK